MTCYNYCCSTTGLWSIYVGYDVRVYMCAAIYAGNDASGHNRRTDVMSGDTDTTAAVEVHGRGGRGSAAVDVDEEARPRWWWWWCRCRSRCRRRRRGRRRRRRCVVAVAEAAAAGAERTAGSSTQGGGGGGRDPGAAAVSVMCARCARSRRARAATQFCGARENLDPGEPDARRSAAIDSGGGRGSGGGGAAVGSGSESRAWRRPRWCERRRGGVFYITYGEGCVYRSRPGLLWKLCRFRSPPPPPESMIPARIRAQLYNERSFVRQCVRACAAAHERVDIYIYINAVQDIYVFGSTLRRRCSAEIRRRRRRTPTPRPR